MKKLFTFSLSLILLGQGCLPAFGPSDNPTPTLLPKKAETIETTPAATKTEMVVVAPDDWTKYEHSGIPNFSFYYPGTQSVDTMGMDRGELAAFNLPSNAVVTTQKSFPNRSMTVTIFSEDSEYINGCYYNIHGEATTRDSQENLPPIRINDRTWCISESEENAAGNQFNQTAYATNIGTQLVVFHFSVRSSSCEAYDNPAADCIAYDEVRDSSDFREIIKTFMQ